MNELIPVEALAPAKYADDKTFGALSTAASFLPRVQLYSSGNNEVKKGLIAMGKYGLVRNKDQIEDLGNVLDVLVCGWRPLAMDFGGENPVSFYNPETPEFQAVQEGSNDPDSGKTFGPQFLIWVPSAQIPCFATFYCGNKTARREAPNIKGLIGKAATFKVQFIEAKKYSWHGPVVVPCSTPFANVPDMDDLSATLANFNNPKETEVEVAPVAEEQRAR